MVTSKKSFKGYLYLLPALILLAVFTVWPLINTTRVAFLNGYQMMAELGGTTYEFGIENFKFLFTNALLKKLFFLALKNVAIVCFITVPVSTLLALFISVCLNNVGKIGKVLQSIYFLPYVTNSLAIGMVFAMMFSVSGVGIGTDNPNYFSIGIINNIISVFNPSIKENPIFWIAPDLSSYSNNIFVLCVYSIWNALPFKILILLGSLQSVNKNYYDAAKVDGASKSTVFWKITVPMLSPTIAYLIITGFIGAFKEYSSVVGIFGEAAAMGKSGQMVTMVGIVQRFLKDYQGYASAAAICLFVIILLITLVQLQVQKKRVHY